MKKRSTYIHIYIEILVHQEVLKTFLISNRTQWHPIVHICEFAKEIVLSLIFDGVAQFLASYMERYFTLSSSFTRRQAFSAKNIVLELNWWG